MRKMIIHELANDLPHYDAREILWLRSDWRRQRRQEPRWVMVPSPTSSQGDRESIESPWWVIRMKEKSRAALVKKLWEKTYLAFAEIRANALAGPYCKGLAKVESQPISEVHSACSCDSRRSLAQPCLRVPFIWLLPNRN